jgi:hypothetical protein
MIKYNLTLQQKADLIERYLINCESIKTMYKEFNGMFDSYNKFYCYLKRLKYEEKVLNCIKNPNKEITDRLRVFYLQENESTETLGNKTESYYESEEDIFHNPNKVQLSKSEQKIYDKPRSNAADYQIQYT